MDSNTNKSLQIFLKVASIFLTVAVVALIVVVISLSKSVSNVNSYADTIEVSGTGTVKAIPDVARITFGHSTENADLAQAQKDLEEIISKGTNILKDFGVEEGDISQQNYNSYPRYEYRANCTGVRCVEGDRELVAYEVHQTIQVTVRDIDKAGEVLAALGSVGITQLNGPYFEIDDASLYQQEARSQAIEDAREEAKILAKDLGLRLGKMVDFYENSYGGGPTPYMEGRSLMASDMAVEEASLKTVTVPVGEDEIQVNVTLVFKVR